MILDTLEQVHKYRKIFNSVLFVYSAAVYTWNDPLVNFTARIAYRGVKLALKTWKKKQHDIELESKSSKPLEINL